MEEHDVSDETSGWPEPYLAFSADGHDAAWSPWDTDHVENVSIRWENEAWTATGSVGREDIQYVIRISPMWQVRQFLLFRDLDEPDLWLGTDGHGRWGEMNGDHRPDLDGCVDLDLACTPFTNMLPIRRLPLHVGDTADITVASIDVETLGIRPDHQRYTRLETHRWRFEQLATGLVQEFDVDRHGLVRDAPTLYRRLD
ncbi:MAG: putative glycolipid-binding domain-containing protein [Ilumatobacteraceae bacterium]